MATTPGEMANDLKELLALNKYGPVGIYYGEKPAGAVVFQPGKWGCAVAMLKAAALGKSAALGPEAYGCGGGGLYLGFVDKPRPGLDEFVAIEEGYKKTPELAAKLIAEAIPEPAEGWCVFKPLGDFETASPPQLVSFLVNADQLAALTVWANYDRDTCDNVLIPHSSGCATLVSLALKQAQQEKPKAIVGLTDISARKVVEKDILSFTLPYGMLEKMLNLVDSTFLKKEEWLEIKERNR